MSWMIELTSNVGCITSAPVLSKANDIDILVTLVPLLEPKVELSLGNGVNTGEYQGKVIELKKRARTRG